MEEIAETMPDSSDDLTLLKQYSQEWVGYSESCCPDPFLLVEGKNGEDWSIFRIMFTGWVKSKFMEKYHKRLCNAALELINQERDGQIQDNQECASWAESLTDIYILWEGEDTVDVLHEVWLLAYLLCTESFYNQRADAVLLESNDTQSYMRFACKALEAEEKRCEKYLLLESKSEVMEILTEVLVKNNADLIRLEVSQMITDYDHESLKLMFNLMDRVENGEQPIIKELEQQILSRGKLGLKNINVNDGEALGKDYS